MHGVGWARAGQGPWGGAGQGACSHSPRGTPRWLPESPPPCLSPRRGELGHGVWGVPPAPAGGASGEGSHGVWLLCFRELSVGPEVKGWVGSRRQTQCPRYHPACVLRTTCFGLYVLGVDLLGGGGKCGSQEAAGARHGRAGTHCRGLTDGEVLSCSLATSAGLTRNPLGRDSQGDLWCVVWTQGALGEQQGGKDGKRGAQSPLWGEDGDCLQSFPCPVGQLSLSSRPPDCTGPQS